MIPHRLIRTVPAQTSVEVERLWDVATGLHPTWEHITLRDPIDSRDFPLTSPYWADCETGAQLADLVRVEELWWRGGFYIDSDVWCLKPFDSLCNLDAVVGWEDHLYIPNAVMGFPPQHPALRTVIDMAITRRHQGTWIAGVGVTTTVFKARNDVALLPPAAFYPVHWKTAHRGFVHWDEEARKNPWAYCIHKYAASWHHAA